MERNFYNRTELALYLKQQGFKIGKSTIYLAVKKGLLKIQENGSILPEDALAFQKILSIKKQTSGLSSEYLKILKSELCREIDRRIVFRNLIDEYLSLRLHVKYLEKNKSCGCCCHGETGGDNGACCKAASLQVILPLHSD